jgi:hypothetical protein
MKNFHFPISVLLLFLLLTQCSIKNSEDQLPLSFIEKDFQSINLPDLKDGGLEFAAAPKPTLIRSQSASRMIQNLDASSVPSDLTEETKSKILLTKYIAEISSPDLINRMLTEIDGLNESSLSLIFFGRPSLNASISEVVKAVMDNSKFQDLFSKLISPKIPPVTGVVTITKPKSVSYKISPSTGNCGKAAQDALDRAIRRLQEKRDEQLTAIESNLQVRIREANERFIARNLDAEKIYNLNLKASADEVAKLLKAAQRMRSQNPVLAEELRLLALTMAVANQLIFLEEFQAATNANKLTKDNEIMIATLRKQDLEAEINRNFNTESDNAITTLNRVLAACHNQGGGN